MLLMFWWGGMFMDTSIFDTLEQKIHTIPQLLYNNREYAGEQMANLFQEEGIVYKISYDEMLLRVECIAIGLLKLNIMKGDRIVFIGTPSARMLWVDLGVMCTGAISIPLQNEDYTIDLRDLARHADLKAVVLDRAELVEPVKQMAIPHLQYIICLERGYRGDGFNTFGAGEIYYMGKFSYETLMPALQERLENIDGVDPAVLFYPPKWDGRSKPALYTHKFVLSTCSKAMRYLYRLGYSLGNRELFNVNTAPMEHFLGGMQAYLWPLLVAGCLDFVAATKDKKAYQVYSN